METYAAPGFIGADFGDLEMRVAAMHHDEVVIEMKTGTSASPDAMLKQLQGYASLFGLTDAQKKLYASVNYLGKTRDDALDAVAYNMSHLTRMRFRGKCNAKQRLWAMAFQDALGVGDAFYADANPMRKHYLEQHYTELAKHDTRKGRKAAKVVATRVMYALEDEEPAPAFKAQGSMTGRVSSTIQNIPKSKKTDRLFGSKFDKIIIDEIADWTPKKP